MPVPTSPKASKDKNIVYRKTLKEKVERTTDGHSTLLKKTVAYKEASTSGTCIGSPAVKDASVQEQISNASRGTQCNSRNSQG